MGCGAAPSMDTTDALQALRRSPTLTKLGLQTCRLSPDEARELCMTLCNIPSLQSLDLTTTTLGSVELAELAPALYHNTTIKVLYMSKNNLNDIESAELLRDIFRSNKTITTLDFSGNKFGETTGAVDCIADGLGSNSTLVNIDLSSCDLGDGGVSTLAQTFSSRSSTLQKLTLQYNSITSTGVGVLLDTMERSCHITDLDLGYNPIGNEGAILLARALQNNTLPNLTRLSLSKCGIGDDGFITLMSAMEHNKPLLHIDLSYNTRGLNTKQAFLALAESLPEIKVLQRADFCWCRGFTSAMLLFLAGLRKNTSLFLIDVAQCAPHVVPPTPAETAKCAGCWMWEMKCLGYRNRIFSLMRAPKKTLPPRGVWPHALARDGILPDVIFYVLRSKPSLVPSGDTDDMEAIEGTEIS
jgi:Ran GTPase-activating protein (RanGAP) involved in mRNA processing and transport